MRSSDIKLKNRDKTEEFRTYTETRVQIVSLSNLFYIGTH